MTIQPIIERTHPVGSGTQRIYRFDNGLGASVVQFTIGAMAGSYGADQGLWELAVLRFTGDGENDYELTYDTGLTDDVIGHLDDEEVQALLAVIREMRSPGDAATIRVESTVGDTPALPSGKGGAR